MSILGIIGGTGISDIPGLAIVRREVTETRYGTASSPLIVGDLEGQPVILLQRHGAEHDIPPHLINYRANLSALNDAGVDRIVALAAVGGIHSAARPGSVVLPDDLIDYSHGRISSFWDADDRQMRHVEFAPPFDSKLRHSLLDASGRAGVSLLDQGVYGVTQGPRLETAAEIRRLESDGCTLVGMTAMPEAALARELDMPYAVLAMVVNHAAGTAPPGSGGIHDDIEAHLSSARNDAYAVIRELCRRQSGAAS